MKYNQQIIKDNRMKILIVSHFYKTTPPVGTGSIEFFTDCLANTLAKNKNNEVLVICKTGSTGGIYEIKTAEESDYIGVLIDQIDSFDPDVIHVMFDDLKLYKILSEKNIPVISEESELPDFELRKKWAKFWLIDPIDGTKEFINRNGEFTVNIALIENGEPILGVVNAPAMQVLYFANKDHGAWRERDGMLKRIYSNNSKISDHLTLVESRSHNTLETEHFLSKYNIKNRIAMGSSLKFCLVAEGTAAFYSRMGPTMEWDVAAGDCIYRNATKSGYNSSPFTYNKIDLKNEPFVLGL